MKTYRKRILDDLILRRSQTAGAILVEGIKWCGKTTTCEQAAKSVVYLDDPEKLEHNLGSSEFLVVSEIIKNTEPPSAGARRVLGGLLRDLKQLKARVQLLPTLSDSGGRSVRPPFGLPTVLRFARFRVMDISLSVIELQVRRETAQIAKGWPFFRASLTRSRSCSYLRQSTRHACSLDLSPQSTMLRRATLG